MTDTERIEKLEKENEVMKKVLIILIATNINYYGELKNFDSKNKEMLEKLLGELIL